MTWPYLVSGQNKKTKNLTKIPISFDTLAQIQWEGHFCIAVINAFRMIYNFFRFAKVRIFPLFLVMTSGSSFTEGGGWKTPLPSAAPGAKSPVLFLKLGTNKQRHRVLSLKTGIHVAPAHLKVTLSFRNILRNNPYSCYKKPWRNSWGKNIPQCVHRI